MPNHIAKTFTNKDANQTLQSAYNDVDATVSVNGFLVGKVGNNIQVSGGATATVTYTFFDNALQLYQIQLVYTDSTQTQLVSATRIS